MRPVREIPEEFVVVEDELGKPLPLLEEYLESLGTSRPLADFRFLLVQHQLSNQVKLVDALIRLGADPQAIYWLDIPYTSNADIRGYVIDHLGLSHETLRICDDYSVLDPYAMYQHARTVNLIVELGEKSTEPLVVLDDGAYVLRALSTLRQDRWPDPIAIVEQTTRGFIKMAESAAMQAVAASVPVVDVARSTPKRTLEPPFIAMAVCASLERAIGSLIAEQPTHSVLILGYGAIGEQVASYVTAERFGIIKKCVYVQETNKFRRDLATRRGFRVWDRADLSQRFDLVIGCSGRGSFKLGDREYLHDGALLASASSGAVELSRREFIEFADATPHDDIKIIRNGLDEADIHSNITMHLVDRTSTFVNAGFPVNFDGRLNTIPLRFIQPTPTLMTRAAVQAAASIKQGQTGIHELHRETCDWIDSRFRELLGDDAHYLVPPPDEAW